MIAAGVCISDRIACEKINPSTTMTNVNTPPAISAVDISRFNLAISPAPKKLPINTDIPRQMPTMRNNTIFIIGLAAPTAASALAPIKRPTIMESAAL